MSNSNIHITDEEMRSMLNTLLLSTNTSEPINNNFTDMEATIIFSQPEMLAFGAPKEKEILQKLKSDFNDGFNFKWLLVLLMAITTIGITYLLVTPKKSPIANKVETVKSNNTKEQVILIPLQKAENKMGKNEVTVNSFDPQNPVPTNSSILLIKAKDSINTTVIADNNSGSFVDNITSLNTESTTELASLFDPQMEKQFPVDTIFNGVKRIEIAGSYIPVTINQNTSEQLTIKGIINVEVKGKKNKSASLEVSYEKIDEVLKVYIILKEKSKWISTGTINITGFLHFAIPKYCDLVVNNTSGEITVDGVSGKICDLQSHYGSIKASNLSMPIKVETMSGNIKLNEINNAVDAHSDYGNIDMQNIKGDLKLFCASGNVHLENLTGNCKIDSKYGNVNAINLSGDLAIKAQSGNIDLEHLNGNICTINDSYGNIQISDSKADFDIDATSGNIKTDRTEGKLNLNSKYGSQRISDSKGDIVSVSNSGDGIFKNINGNMDIESLYGDLTISESKGNADINLKSGNVKMKNMLVLDSLSINNGYGDIRLKLLNNESDLSYDLSTTTGDISFSKQPERNKDKKGSVLVSGGKVWIKANTSTGDISID